VTAGLTVAAFMGTMALTKFGMAFEAKAANASEIQALPAHYVETFTGHFDAVDGDVYMLTGAGGAGNTTVQIGKDGVLVVDTQRAANSDELLAAIRRLSNKPIREIINTSADADHIGGNEILAKAGKRMGFIQQTQDIATSGAVVRSHLKVQDRLSAPTGKTPAVPFALWPTDVFASESKDIYFNGESIRLLHQPAAHTDGDIIVYFRRSDVISAGDVFSTVSYPVIDLEKGGSIKGMLDALNYIIDLAIPEDKEEGGTIIIPGHGHLCAEADVVDYRDMVTIIRDRVQDMIGKGMTLEQVKAARPTFDYDGLYGSNTGAWTTDMFVEAVYKGLKK
jgi:cyclase